MKNSIINRFILVALALMMIACNPAEFFGEADAPVEVAQVEYVSSPSAQAKARLNARILKNENAMGIDPATTVGMTAEERVVRLENLVAVARANKKETHETDN